MHYTKKQKAVISDRDWWRQVGNLIGATLYGWSYRHSASFIHPQLEVGGKVAAILLDQQAEIGRLKGSTKRTGECFGRLQAAAAAVVDTLHTVGEEEPPHDTWIADINSAVEKLRAAADIEAQPANKTNRED